MFPEGLNRDLQIRLAVYLKSAKISVALKCNAAMQMQDFQCIFSRTLHSLGFPASCPAGPRLLSWGRRCTPFPTRLSLACDKKKRKMEEASIKKMGNSGTVVRNTKKGFRMGQFHKKWCTTVLKFHAAASFAWAFNFPRRVTRCGRCD